MATIAFVSSKGGVGKTTSALLLALGLHDLGHPVVLVDSDPNLPLTAWAHKPGRPSGVTVLEAPTFADLPGVLRSAKRVADWVVVDTEGGAPRLGGLAVANADLVVSPLAASVLEVREALKAERLVADVAQRERRSIGFTTLFCRTPGGMRRTFAAVREELETEGVPVMNTVITDKEAFRALFASGGTLSGMKSARVSGLPGAREILAAYADEVVSLI